MSDLSETTDAAFNALDESLQKDRQLHPEGVDFKDLYRTVVLANERYDTEWQEGGRTRHGKEHLLELAVVALRLYMGEVRR
jgi:hypothetical protein